MAVRNATIPTLTDVVTGLNPNGTQADIAEILTQDNPMLEDAAVKEGNLVTGNRITVRTSKPTVGWRRLNQGVPSSKGTSSQVDEASALLEGRHQVDRELAILSGNPAEYRWAQGRPFIESMNDEAAETIFYGNSNFNDTEFTGLAPRFNELANSQVIDGGGTGTDNRSIWLIGWHPEKVSLIYPKGTTGGLNHFDATANKAIGEDGFPIGDEVADEDGNTYMAYKDRWIWRLGLSVEDPRFVVRIANIDVSLLSKDASTGADIQDLMIQAEDKIKSLQGVNAAFYVPGQVSSMLRRQLVTQKSAYMNWGQIGGKQVTMFGETPVRRADALNVDEDRVV